MAYIKKKSQKFLPLSITFTPPDQFFLPTQPPTQPPHPATHTITSLTFPFYIFILYLPRLEPGPPETFAKVYLHLHWTTNTSVGKFVIFVSMITYRIYSCISRPFITKIQPKKIALHLYTSHTQIPDQAIQEISITIA